MERRRASPQKLTPVPGTAGLDGASRGLESDSEGTNTLQQLVAERALTDLGLEGDERVFDLGRATGMFALEGRWLRNQASG